MRVTDRVADFVQDVVTGPGLQKYGLDNPSRQITLRSAVGDTNSVIAQLLFGAATTNQIYVKRADEDFVYALATADLSPAAGQRLVFPRTPHLEFPRDERRAGHAAAKWKNARSLIRTGTNQWSLAAGSQGIINPPAVEETVHRLGDLTVAGWIGRNYTAAEATQQFGLNTNNLSLTIELKSGEKYSLDFGAQVAQTALAAVTLDGERWAFVFPPVLFPLVAEQSDHSVERPVICPASGANAASPSAAPGSRSGPLVLLLLAAFAWFNVVGLPGFLKTRLVTALHQRGVELEFTRMRLRIIHGLICDNVRFGWAKNSGSSVLTAREVQLRLNFPALLRRRWQVDGLVLRQGNFILPLSPTNSLALTNLQSELRFAADDTWALDQFRADFAGAKISLRGEISHAAEIRQWKMFSGSEARDHGSVQATLNQFSRTLEQIHFAGRPELNVRLNGDARDVHSFALHVNARVPGVATPWFAAQDLQFTARLAAPADAPTNCDPAWSFWTNLQPFRLDWIARGAELRSDKLDTGAVECDGFWIAPELAVTKLSARLGGGQLDAAAKLDVATRELNFTNESAFDLHAVAALLTEKTARAAGGNFLDAAAGAAGHRRAGFARVDQRACPTGATTSSRACGCAANWPSPTRWRTTACRWIPCGRISAMKIWSGNCRIWNWRRAGRSWI